MGKKTDKKIKLDRINILRKQYDAFLEEDKKRKDRNDYILGRLDNMRYSSTAVQLRHTPSAYRDHIAPSYDSHINKPENLERNNMQMVRVNQHITRPSYQSLQLDVPRNYIDETSILKEISQKYILIPKLRSKFTNDGIEAIPPLAQSTIPAPVSSEKPSDIDNNDWKSKYDILEQLKKKENEEVKFTNKDGHFDSKESSTKNDLERANDNDHVMQNYIRDELPTRYEEEIPEKDVSSEYAVEKELKSLEKCTINENIEQVLDVDVAHKQSSLSLNSEKATPYYDQAENEVYGQYAPEIATTVQENMEHYTQPEQYVVPAEQNVEVTSHTDNNQYEQNYPEKEFQPQQEQPYPIEYEEFIPNTEAETNQSRDQSSTDYEKVIDQEENDYNPIEVINPNELVDEINKDMSEQEAGVLKTAYLNPNEIADTQEFSPDAVTLQDGQRINPENYVSEEGTIVEGNPVPQMSNEEPVDNSGIEDFDAEQREMFYSEQANENYAYDNQGAAGGAYDEYAQNQNYQGQDVAYYENAQQEEGTYPAEINEHEETQQLYDQHYEQQYANANYEQGYEQQTVYMEQDPNQQQFEQPALYDQAQQEFEQYNLHPQPAGSQEQVEEVLDQEDGFIEKRAEDTTAQDQKTAELNTQ